MVNAREENAAEMEDDERRRSLADAAILEQPGLIPDDDMEYDDWLELTGLDDSFVGDGLTVPGTADLYDAAIRAYNLRSESSPTP